MFRFRLERVLRHRRRRVDACAQAVAAAERSLRAAEAAVADARAAVRDHDEAGTALRRQTVDTGALDRARQWRDELRRREAAAEGVRDEALAALAEAQESLQHAWRDREALERLKARQHEEWKHAEGRRRQRELDEIAAIRAAIGSEAVDTAAGGGRES